MFEMIYLGSTKIPLRAVKSFTHVTSRSLSLWAVFKGETRHNIGDFDDFGRSRDGDDTLQVAATPTVQKSNSLN